MEEIFKKVTGYDWTNNYITIQNMNKNRSYVKILKRPSSYYLREHLNHNRIIVLPQFPGSKILKLDIDQRSNLTSTQTIVDTIVECFGTQCLLEYSPTSKGYHIFYKTSEALSDPQKKQIEKYFKENFEFEIEVKKTKENLKLPFSKFYPLFGVYTESEENKISSIISVNNTLEQKLNTITDNFQFMKETKIPIKYIKIENDFSNQLRNTRITNMQAYADLNRNFSKEELISKFGYGNGTRYMTQYKIAKYCKERGLSYNNFVQCCEICNINHSKDMANPRVKDYKLKEAWTFGCKIAGQTKDIVIESNHIPETYIKQNYELSKEEIYQLRVILEYNIKQNDFFTYRKNIERSIEDCIKVYQEIRGRQEFDEKQNTKYKDKRFQFLNGSTAVAKSTFQKMSKLLGIKNIAKVKKILISSGLLVEVAGNRGFSYSFRWFKFCKHFLISSVNSLYMYIINIYKNINKYINSSGFKNTLIYVIKFMNQNIGISERSLLPDTG